MCILVQIAMEIESSIIDMIENKEEVNINNYKYYKGKLNNKDIVISISKVGTINASASLALAIKEFNPSVIINAGIAGAMNKKLHIKDVIIATNCININSYKTLNYKENEGIHPENWELLTFLSGEEDRFISYSSDTKLLEHAKKISGNLIFGTIGSGDVWNCEVDRIIYLNEKYGVLCEDMESISTYTLAYNNNIPVISIKIISDNILTFDEYDRNTGKYLQQILFEYLNILTKN